MLLEPEATAESICMLIIPENSRRKRREARSKRGQTVQRI
jgi:hypothetical protein